MKAVFKSDFQKKTELFSENPRAAYGRWIFLRTEFVLILKTGERTTHCFELEVNVPRTIAILRDGIPG